MTAKVRFAETVLHVYDFLMCDCGFSSNNAILMIKNALNNKKTQNDTEKWTEFPKEL